MVEDLTEFLPPPLDANFLHGFGENALPLVADLLAAVLRVDPVEQLQNAYVETSRDLLERGKQDVVRLSALDSRVGSRLEPGSVRYLVLAKSFLGAKTADVCSDDVDGAQGHRKP